MIKNITTSSNVHDPINKSHRKKIWILFTKRDTIGNELLCTLCDQPESFDDTNNDYKMTIGHLNIRKNKYKMTRINQKPVMRGGFFQHCPIHVPFRTGVSAVSLHFNKSTVNNREHIFTIEDMGFA